MQLKNTFIIIIFFLAVQFVTAQETYVIYEGTQLNYRVGVNDGNTYAWEVVQGSNTVEYDFVTVPNSSEVTVLWNMTGLYYLTVNETDLEGCSNKKALAVHVQPNNRSIGFDIVASAECFNTSDNSFAVAVLALDNNGQPISANYFPLNVEFSVNGQVHTQELSFNNQNIQINEAWFTVNPTINTDVLVEIGTVTDIKNTPIKADGTNGTHTRSIFAIPEIEFTEELRQKYNLNYEAITAYYNSDDSRLERMEPE